MRFSTAALSIATLSLAMLTPSFGQAASQGADTQPTSVSEAQNMVPARASLTRALDAKSIHTGDTFRATLSDNVHLNGGIDLRKGDTLIGEVATDDMNTTGNSRLAVRFTQAVQKNGKTIPIKATIVALYSPDTFSSDIVNQPEQFSNSWSQHIVSIDQIGVANGVDLHSRIASQNSGVFVTTTKKDVKIPAGSEIALAIAPQGNSAPTNSGD